MLTIDPELEMTLKALARQEHISPNEIIKRLISYYVRCFGVIGLSTTGTRVFANRKGFGICIYFYRELVRSRAETAGKGRAVDDSAVQENLAILGLGFISFDLQHADKAGELWQITSPFGLSLGDRACLATGLIENMPVMTADQVWQKLSLPLDVRLIR